MAVQEYQHADMFVHTRANAAHDEEKTTLGSSMHQNHEKKHNATYNARMHYDEPHKAPSFLH